MGNDDFRFQLVPALSGDASPAVSFQSTNYPDRYLTVINENTVGIVQNQNSSVASSASWFLRGAGPAFTIESVDMSGFNLAFSNRNSAPCAYSPPSGDLIIDTQSNFTFILSVPPPPRPETITIDATNVSHRINPLFMGCHTDPGYTQEPRGWYSQLVYGESFEKGTTSVYAWNNITQSPGQVSVAVLDSTVVFNPKVNAASLKISFSSGNGVAGWSNRGIGNEGMHLVRGQLYEGYLFVRNDGSTNAQLWVAVNDYLIDSLLNAVEISVKPSPEWQMVRFTLTPSRDTTCKGIAPGSTPTIDCGNMGPNPGHICIQCSGELQVGLSAPGNVHIGYVFFQPGEWGRVPGLPVLRSAADVMIEMGTRVIRQGGTVSQTFTWKDWRGVPWERASMQHVWGDSLVSGWGLFEFIDMCNVLGIKPIVTLAFDTNSVTDWGDLVEYLWGNSSTAWGRVRTFNDSHPQPYNVTTFELGNEEENPNFAQQVIVMEQRRRAVGAPTLQYMYPTNQGVSTTTASALVSGGVAPEVIMPDCHVGGTGGIQCATTDFAAIPNFHQSFINCETNAGISTVQRAVQEAEDLQQWFNYGLNLGEDPKRLVARTASFCAERSGHYDAFDQGISFFLPNMTWMQPPGYVHVMIARALQPNAVYVSSTDGTIPTSAQKSDDGLSLTIQIVNKHDVDASVTLVINGFTPYGTVTITTMGSNDKNGGNTPAQPTLISPMERTVVWPGEGGLKIGLGPNSFTVVTVQSQN
jgi:hypothetical protein